MTNEYMTEEEEKEYGTMRRSKIAGFSLQDDRNFTAKSSPRWEYLCIAWVKNVTMTEYEVKELERIIPNYKEVLKKYVEDGVGCPYEINTPEEFVEWVMKDKSWQPDYKCGKKDWTPKDAYPNTSNTTLEINDVPTEPYQEMCDEYIDDVVKESVNITQNNKYNREIKKGVFVDVYDVLRAFSVSDPALQHLIKKALAVGQRGHKSTKEDYEDILASAKRALEIYTEWQ